MQLSKVKRTSIPLHNRHCNQVKFYGTRFVFSLWCFTFHECSAASNSACLRMGHVTTFVMNATFNFVVVTTLVASIASEPFPPTQ